MKKINTVLLAAKNIKSMQMTSQLMTSIRGKPVILWCLNSLFEKGFVYVDVIINQHDIKLKSFLSKNVYFTHYHLNIIEVDDKAFQHFSILDSLDVALQSVVPSLPTQIILADTMIYEPFPSISDVFYTSKNITASDRWCLIEKNEKNYVTKFFDKIADIDVENKEALVGYYKLSNTALLQTSVEKALEQKKRHLSDAFALYDKYQPIQAIITKSWIDFGHISGIVDARFKLFNVRAFNRLSVDAVRGTIMKSSKDKQKIKDELHWFQSLPNDLKVLTPKILNSKEDDAYFYMEMELLGYPSLSECFVYGENSLEDWHYILKKVFQLHRLLDERKAKNDKAELEALYIHKTQKRLLEIEGSNTFKEIIHHRDIMINGRHFKNLLAMKDDIMQKCIELSRFDGDFSIVHGDYCFSNILFDSMYYVFRLIDPRGRFKSDTLYCDPRYDYAKLRHSFVGLYDYVVLGFYHFKQLSRRQFEYKIVTTKNRQQFAIYFNRLLSNTSLNAKEVESIEALLFLTMLPLHKDDIQRQKVLYLIAIEKLNKVLYDD